MHDRLKGLFSLKTKQGTGSRFQVYQKGSVITVVLSGPEVVNLPDIREGITGHPATVRVAMREKRRDG
jgi:hypothetical protein